MIINILKGEISMNKHYHIYTSKNGEKYVQTSNKYLAHGLAFCGFEFKAFKVKDIICYSFEYSEELINTVENTIELRHSNIVRKTN